MTSSQDEFQWLDRLGESRPGQCADLTQEILDQAGQPPLPYLPAYGATYQQMLAYETVKKTLSLAAEDRSSRAWLEVKSLRESTSNDLRESISNEADLTDAQARAHFWQQVSEWANSIR